MISKKIRMPSLPRLSGRLYLFPAFLPLIEIVPWLLTAMAALAGAAGLSVRAVRGIRIFLFALFCLAIAGGFWWYHQPDPQTKIAGTRLILPHEHPTAKVNVLPPANPLSSGGNFREVWSKTLTKQVLSTPVLTKDYLVYGSYDGTIEAVSRHNGALVWSLPLKSPVFALTSGVENNLLYAGEGLHHTTAASLTAIDPLQVKVLWQREFIGHLEESAAIDAGQGMIITSAGPGGLWALDIDDADVIWHAPIGHIDSKALITQDIVYTMAQPDEAVIESALFALDARTGKEIWRIKLPGQPWGSPLMDVKTGNIIVTTGTGQIGVRRETDSGWVHAIEPKSQKIIWQKQLPSKALQPDIYLPDHDMIVYSVKSGELVAVRPATGETRWTERVSAELQAPAALLEGQGDPLIASMGFDGIFSIRRALTGEEVARRDLKGSSTSSPVSDGDLVYATTAYGLTVFSGIDSLRSKE